jgi:hypothetical protein
MAIYLGLLTIMAGVYLLLHGLYSHAHRRAIGAAASPRRRANIQPDVEQPDVRRRMRDRRRLSEALTPRRSRRRTGLAAAIAITRSSPDAARRTPADASTRPRWKKVTCDALAPVSGRYPALATSA